MGSLLEQLAYCIERGKENITAPYPPDMKDQKGVFELAKDALEEGFTPEQVLKEGMMIGMNRIGEKFADGKAFIPELLISAKAMYAGMDVLKPYFDSGEVKRKGTIIIGTVAGDLHDIGKNIVKMVLEGDGWEVIDLGVDTNTEKFVSTLEAKPDSFVGMSALLTTTMANMEKSVQTIREKFSKTKIFIGGAPVTDAFKDKIGADGYFADPHSFVSHLNSLVQ